MSERPDSAPRPDEFASVAAVVCNFNGEQHLGPCLEGLAAQGGRLSEILVVDNASTDRSLERVRTHAPEARIVALARNDGPCPARNRGLAEVATPWVLLLDNDAVLMPGVLEALVAAARARPDAAIVQPRSVFDGDPSRVHYDGGECHYVGLFALRNFYRPLAEAPSTGVVEVGGAVSVALLVRRTLVLEAGGFDPRYFILFEDLDLSLRLRARGHAILSVEDALVRHRGGTPGISFRDAGRYPRSRALFHSRNRWFVLATNYRWRTLLVCAPAFAAYELVWFAFCLASGTLGGWFAGKWAFLRALPSTLELRARAQAARTRPDRELLVGGPLTIAPQLYATGVRGRALALLDACLRTYWTLVRPLSG